MHACQLPRAGLTGKPQVGGEGEDEEDEEETEAEEEAGVSVGDEGDAVFALFRERVRVLPPLCWTSHLEMVGAHLSSRPTGAPALKPPARCR